MLLKFGTTLLNHFVYIPHQQEFLSNRTNYVTVSVDRSLRLPYGTRLCIAPLNRHFGRHIRFEVRDSSQDLQGAGFGQVEICVRTETDSYEDIVNLSKVTLFA